MTIEIKASNNIRNHRLILISHYEYNGNIFILDANDDFLFMIEQMTGKELIPVR